MAAPCPSCDACELSRLDGDSFISCASCGRLWTEDEYERLALIPPKMDVGPAHRILEAQLPLLQPQARTRQLLRQLVGAWNLPVERYDNGYANYIDVLDTERNLFSAQLALTAAYGDRYRVLVDLYRGLGGDWIGPIAPLPSAPWQSTQL